MRNGCLCEGVFYVLVPNPLMVGNGVGEGGVVLRSLGQRGTVSEERRLELANTLVILIGAQCATFEDLFGEGCAMFCFTVPCV